MKNLEIEYVRCQATPGAHLHKCAQEAAILALNENRVIHFFHNNLKYQAIPKILLDTVLKTGE